VANAPGWTFSIHVTYMLVVQLGQKHVARDSAWIFYVGVMYMLSLPVKILGNCVRVYGVSFSLDFDVTV
jgi:hypothetical protein